MTRQYAFGEYVLDLDAAELRRGNEKLSIRPKCFDVLVYLLDRPGKLVTKDELLDRVWSDAVVSEATLSRTVTELRAVLKDDTDQPRFIETVARRGYKFIGQVVTPRVEHPVTEYSLVHRTTEYPLRDGEQLIGRGRDVAVPLYTSATSRHHAKIVVSPDGVVLEDLGSRNGTLVNGRRVHGTVRLEVGDQIEIGGERLILWSPTGETETSPVPAP